MNDSVKMLDKSSAVEAINKLNESDLRFLNRLIIERLKIPSCGNIPSAMPPS